MKRFILIIFTIFSLLPALAQKQKLKNIPYIDQRRFHYGFALGLSMSDVTFLHTGENSWFAECPSVNPAFCVGLIGDMALTENLSLRCQPMLYFISRNVSLRNSLSGEIVKQDLKSCNLEVPLSLKIATRRLNNYRPYVLTGASMVYDMAKDKETPIALKNLDFGIHIALGTDTYLPFFKFCPEIRFDLGLTDVIDHRRKGLKDETMMKYTDAIRKAHTKSVSLIFHFE